MNYYIKGTVAAEIECDVFELDGIGTGMYADGTQEFNEDRIPNYADEILSIINDAMSVTRSDGTKETLADFAPEPIKDKITDISIGLILDENNVCASLATIGTNGELTESEKVILIDWLIGQYSDGIGESIEQAPFHRRYVEKSFTQYDDIDDNFYVETDYTTACYYFKLWTDKAKYEYVDADKSTYTIID